MVVPLPRTVILDFYDSYTNNLLTLFTRLYSDQEVLKKVVVIKADRYTWEEFQSIVLPSTDCVILSPGPGRPDNSDDAGFALDLLRAHSTPILGVCLGHQAIGVAFGGKIINTPRITHGHVVPVLPVSPAKGLFATAEWQQEGSGQFDVVVYNSLTVDPASLPPELEVTAWSAGEGSERTIQGLMHRDYPIWGAQYHPESISSTRGPAFLQAFLSQVHSHHSQPPSYLPLPEHIISACAYRVSAGSSKRPLVPLISPYPTPPMSRSGSPDQAAEGGGRRGAGRRLRLVERHFRAVGREAKTGDVFEPLRRQGKGRAVGAVWLDGETPLRPTTTSLSLPSFLLTYTVSRRLITLYRPTHPPTSIQLGEQTFWDWFADGQRCLSSRLDTDGGVRGRGWQGGWVGWMGYEMGQESLAGYPRPPKSGIEGEVGKVDAAWAWCDRILERKSDGEWIARGLVEDQEGERGGEEEEGMISWLESLGIDFGTSSTSFDTWTSDVLAILSNPPTDTISPIPKSAFPDFRPRDTGSEYQRRIQECREAIHQGESYELTLTTRFTASFLSQSDSPSSNSTLNTHLPPSPTSDEYPDAIDPLSLYLHLRTSNPAYYSTYLSFPHLPTPRGTGLTILSSSPERFLKVEQGVVEMMPIKGTRARVKQGECCCSAIGEECRGGKRCKEIAGEVDRRRGEELRLDPKERAENLMIVDLIRADLLSCCIPSTVLVPKLIALESYGVHNLVTTVRGQLAPNVTVVEAVKRCFPPGSMTGAPKLRSVRLLEGIEKGERRGVYSGCLGYLSVDGNADLSVVIRTMVLEGDQLSLGAGGAITWLSKPQGEWDEVLTKVKSVVGNLSQTA